MDLLQRAILLAGLHSIFISDFSAFADTLPQATIYEDAEKSGHSIDYFENAGHFAEVEELISSKGLSKVALLCATGVFLLYNNDFYYSESDDEVAILAGQDTCTPPGHMESLLAIQSYQDVTTDTLTIFKLDRFLFPYLKRSQANEFNIRELRAFQEIKSFILMGTKTWHIVTAKGESFCIKANVETDLPVCPVPRAHEILTKDQRFWASTTTNCPEGTHTITLKYCFNSGSGQLEPITDPNSEVTTTMAPTSGQNLFDNCDENMEEFALLIKIRMRHDFGDLYQTQFPFNKAYAWRTEILDNTIEIFLQSVATLKVIHKQFILMVREWYIYFAEKLIWAQGKGWPSDKPTQRILLVAHETSRCLNAMPNPTIWDSNQMLSGATKLSTDEINSRVKHQDGLNVLMEFIWHIINIVGPTCHQLLNYETDFWLDYMNVVNDMYLHPMAEFWGNPGIVTQYFPVILGGYDIQKQLKGLQIFTTAIFNHPLSQIFLLERPHDVNGHLKNFTTGSND